MKILPKNDSIDILNSDNNDFYIVHEMNIERRRTRLPDREANTIWS